MVPGVAFVGGWCGGGWCGGGDGSGCIWKGRSVTGAGFEIEALQENN